MKYLKVIVFLLIIIAIALFGLNYISPNDIQVTESVEINSNPSVVYEEVSQLSKMGEWQPWLKKDPNAEVSITGTDGQAGAVRSWSSENKEVGVGEQELTKLLPNQRVESKLRFKKPFELEADSYIQLDAVKNGKTKVTWGMNTTVPFPVNIMMKFQMKGMHKQFANGLATLKTTCDNANATTSANAKTTTTNMKKNTNKYTFTEVQRPKTTYVMKRSKIKMDEIGAFYQTNMPKIYNVVLAAGGELNGNPSGLVFDWNEETMVSDLAVALPVKNGVKAEGYETYIQTAGTYLKVSYFGPYENTEVAHAAMDKFMLNNAYESNGIVIEEYVNDPTKVNDPSEIQTDIYYAVKRVKVL